MWSIFWLKKWHPFFSEIEFMIHQNGFPESAPGPKMEPGNKAKIGSENEPQIGTQNQRQTFFKPTPRHASKPACKPASEHGQTRSKNDDSIRAQLSARTLGRTLKKKKKHAKPYSSTRPLCTWDEFKLKSSETKTVKQQAGGIRATANRPDVVRSSHD